MLHGAHYAYIKIEAHPSNSRTNIPKMERNKVVISIKSNNV